MRKIILALFVTLGLLIPISAGAAYAGDTTGPTPGDTLVAKVQLHKQGSKPCTSDICPQAYVVRTSGSAAWGELSIYWNGYQNYAYMNRMGGARGTSDFTRVQIWVDNTGQFQDDSGYYRYYAGPVYSGPSGGRCISAYGEMRTNGETLTANFHGACG